MDENHNSSEQASKSEWIDISIPLRDKMAYGHPKDAPRIQIAIHPTKDKPITLWNLNMMSHTGTHIDAPRHLIPDGITIDKMPLDVAIGPARVIEIKDPEIVKPEELEPCNIRQGERILLKTRNSSRCYETDELVEDFLSSLDFFRFEQRPERWAWLERHYGPVVTNHLLAIEREIICNRGFLDRYDHSTLRKLIFEDPVWSRIRDEARAALEEIGFDLAAWEQEHA